MKTKYLIPALSIFLCSCGDDITRNTYIQEYKGIDVIQYLVEPCVPRELVANDSGDIFVCSTDSTWTASNKKVDTVFVLENDTVMVIEKDTITINTKDTVVMGEQENNLPKCGSKSYDTLTHFCDERDNKVYRWVKIGTQTWMAENLNYGTKVETNSSMEPLTYGTSPNAQKLCYNNDENMCDIYGGLYTRGLATCPIGWHCPDTIEWAQLQNYAVENYGDTSVLKSKYVWPKEQNGNDTLGFSILPAGYLIRNSGLARGYFGLGKEFHFYISGRKFPFGSDYLGSEVLAGSIRCIKDD